MLCRLSAYDNLYFNTRTVDVYEIGYVALNIRGYYLSFPLRLCSKISPAMTQVSILPCPHSPPLLSLEWNPLFLTRITGASSEDETGRPSHLSSNGGRSSAGSSNVTSSRGAPSSRSVLSNTGAVGGRKVSGSNEAGGGGRGGRTGGGGASSNGGGGRGGTGTRGSRGGTSTTTTVSVSCPVSDGQQPAMEQSTPSVASAPTTTGSGDRTTATAAVAAGMSSRAAFSSRDVVLTTAALALGGGGEGGGGMTGRTSGGVVRPEEVLEAPTAPRRRRGRKGRSIYRGVCVTREGKWRAVIYKERKQVRFGTCESVLNSIRFFHTRFNTNIETRFQKA